MRLRHSLTRRVVLLLFPSLAAGGMPSIAVAQQPGEATAQPITLLLGRRHVVRSQINGQAYNVSVVLPSAYDTATQRTDATRYPTFYVLDGEWMLFGRFVRAGYPVSPNVIVVAIAAAADHFQRRTFDYTPPDSSSAWAKRSLQGGLRFGGADAFLRVLKEEIIPLVDRSYRTTGDRGIHGHSYGGLFVAYAMFKAPDLFSRYAMTSPSLWWNDRVLIASEPEFAKQHAVFPKQVFLAIGSEEGAEMTALLYQFAARLCSSMENDYYKGLRLGVETIPGEEHQSIVHQWYAMRALYPADTTGLHRSISRAPAARRSLRQPCG